MDATVAARIYQGGIEAIRIIARGSHKQEAVDTDFESCLTIESTTLIIYITTEQQRRQYYSTTLEKFSLQCLIAQSFKQ